LWRSRARPVLPARKKLELKKLGPAALASTALASKKAE
jgi:hypothetical protein